MAKANRVTVRQSRSRATASRLLEATEVVLRERDFDSASLAQIAREADVTTGAIYSSFEGKDDLLRVLQLEVCAAVEADAYAAFADAPEDVREFLSVVVAAVIETYSARRGALRALAIASRKDAALAGAITGVNKRIVARFAAEAGRRSPSRSAEQDLAAELGFVVITSALRERIVLEAPWALSVAIEDHELVPRLAALLEGLLDKAGHP